MVKSDIEVAREAKMRPIADVGEKLGVPSSALLNYGPYKAKISADYINSVQGNKDGKLVLVTAISPTPAGEGKTTTTVGLGDGLNRIGKKAMSCLREPSLGPCFGVKGGAAGGGAILAKRVRVPKGPKVTAAEFAASTGLAVGDIFDRPKSKAAA